MLSVLLTLGCALVAGGCGSSSGSSTPTQPANAKSTAAPVVRHGLSRLSVALPVSTAQLPAASATPAVERKHLTALFDDAQSTWRRDFAAANLTYKPAHLVVYSGKIESPCGKSEDSGPFYCFGDRTVYLDLQFFSLLVRKFGLRGVAQAYIVAHEFSHHVQNLLGIANRVSAANETDPNGKTRRSVLLELQADCLAGVWGRSAYARANVTVRDLDDASKAAEVIGDDYLAEAAGQEVDSSQWTHGSSKQRQYWLRRGFESGRPDTCNTFAGAKL